MRLTNLDMDALRSFTLGLESGSFARAAERLGRSTSAISAQLKKLEDQLGTPLVRKYGRGVVPTEEGARLLDYARRLLDLNDEAISAVSGQALSGWVHLGLQEDFGETVLPHVLARFARAHPGVQIEGRIARNQELRERIASGQLDLALAWDDGSQAGDTLASIPLRWLAAPGFQVETQRGPLPLIALETPCILRDIACRALDAAGIAWRIAFVSPSLGGLWAATAAGLGIALRTPIGLPATIRTLDEGEFGLPSLPPLDLVLLRAVHDLGTPGEHLAQTLVQAVIHAGE